MANEATCHLILAIPYPGRGHINPLINLCNLISSTRHDINIVVVLTEEWLDLLGSDQIPSRLSFITIPNVLPSELIRGSDHAGFLEAVLRKMEDPVEKVLDRLQKRPDLILSDTFLPWAISMAKRKDLLVASFWPASASSFSVFYHHRLVVGSQHYPIDLSGGRGEEDMINFIPGIPPLRLRDLPDVFQLDRKRILNVIKEAMSIVSQAKHILFRSITDLEKPALESIQSCLSIPIYPIGPAIPYFNSKTTTTTSNPQTEPNYMKWLKNQPRKSVLYISLGSYLLTSNSQIHELAFGLKQSGVRFLWVARDQPSEISSILGDRGMVISWCDQMSVLRHSSVGGFLTHCGWNSTLETAFAGVPALTFPISADQPLDSKMIVEDWRVGWRVKKNCRELVRGDGISVLLKRFMDLDSHERMELDERSKELRERLMMLVAEDGSTNSLDLFFSDVFPVVE